MKNYPGGKELKWEGIFSWSASTQIIQNLLVTVHVHIKYSKTSVTLKKTKIGFQDKLSLNAGHKYCRMLQGEHSAILLTFIKLPFVIQIFVLSIFEWLFYTGFTVEVFLKLLIFCQSTVEDN